MGRGQAAMRGRSVHARRRRPGAGRPLGPRRLRPGAGRPRFACSIWPRCSSRRPTKTAWTGRWTKRTRPSSRPSSSASRCSTECWNMRWPTGIRRPPPPRPVAGQIGTADELLYQGAEPSPLVRAVQNPDRRLRMAALETIVRLQPAQPFAGSSTCRRRWDSSPPAAASAMRWSPPRTSEARDLAGMLAARLPSRHVHQRKDLLQLAARRPTTNWRHRRHHRPAADRHPLAAVAARPAHGVAARGADRPRDIRPGGTLAAVRPAVEGFLAAARRQAFRWQLEQLAALGPREFVDFHTRQRQAAEALDLLAELGRSSGKLYDLRRVQTRCWRPLYKPKLRPRRWPCWPT